MDPNACLDRILNLWRDNEDEALSACEDLFTWLDAGGFPPTLTLEQVEKLTPLIQRSLETWSLCRDLMEKAE